MSFFGFIYKVFGGPIRGLWKVSCEGKENIPESGCILVCNHTSFSDVLVLEVASTRQIFFMGKAELFKIPIFKQLITALGAFPVNRGGADLTSIKRTMAEIHSGKVVGIFPQGTRCPYVDPRETDIKGGVGMIAYRAKADILPVFIDSEAGRTKIFRKNKVTFGKLIKFDEIPFEVDGKKDYEGATRYVFAKACELKYGEGNGTLPAPESKGEEK